MVPTLLDEFHAALFRDVRPHAGRHRRNDYGSDSLTFGPNISLPKELVEIELEEVFGELRKGVDSFEAHPDDPGYEESALRLAAWVHAKLIGIHPYEDGNGRTCRALMNCVLVRLGLHAVRIEAPKQEYLTCLNYYYRTNDLKPLEDLLLRLYDVP